MSCSVKTGNNLHTSYVSLTTIAGVLNTTLYMVSNDKVTIGDLFTEKGNTGTLRQAYLYQTLTTTGTLSTAAMRMDVFAESTALGVAAGALYEIGTANKLIASIDIEATDWVTIDATNSIAFKNLETPVYADSNSTGLYFTLVNVDALNLSSAALGVTLAVAED